MYGWFSATQATNCGFSVYADVNGKEVKVTEVSETSDAWDLDSRWEDMVFVGELHGREIRRAAPSEMENLHPKRLSPEISTFLNDIRRMKDGM